MSFLIHTRCLIVFVWFFPLTWSLTGYFSSTKVATQCFSVAGLPNLNFECAKDEMILVQEAVQGIGAEIGQCTYKRGDCVEKTTTATDIKLREACIGKARCTIPASVAWMEQCKAYSSYNYVIYTCIPKLEIMDICSNSSKALYRKGFISSPNYPEKYPSNINCQCNITTEEDGKLLLQFADYQLEWSQDCEKDIVLVSDGLSRLPRCGQLPRNDKINSKTRQVEVHMETDDWEQHKGFWLHVEALGRIDVTCGPLYTPTTAAPTTIPPTTASPATTSKSLGLKTSQSPNDIDDTWGSDGSEDDYGLIFATVPDLYTSEYSGPRLDNYPTDGDSLSQDGEQEEGRTSLLLVIIICAVVILIFIVILIILILWIRRKRHKEQISKAPVEPYFAKIRHRSGGSPKIGGSPASQGSSHQHNQDTLKTSIDD